MASPMDKFLAAVHREQPRHGVVLGSGLSVLVRSLEPIASIDFSEIPGLPSPSVAGHQGQLKLVRWCHVPVLVSVGRVHFYEGIPWPQVTKMIRLWASWGVCRLVLTNAAGGLHPMATPGRVMILRDVVDLLSRDAWKRLPQKQPLFDADLIELLQAKMSPAFVGTYAGLTGPCYETPAEIRALAAVGVDAVGMSTVREAEAGQIAGMSVAGLSCITNLAAGIAPGPLSHEEVQSTAQLQSAVVHMQAHIETVLEAP